MPPADTRWPRNTANPASYIARSTKLLRELLRVERTDLETQFAGGFAHHMRNILSSGSTAVRLIMRDGVMSENGPLAELRNGLQRLDTLHTEAATPETQTQARRIARSLRDSVTDMEQTIAMIERSLARGLRITDSTLMYAQATQTHLPTTAIDMSKTVCNCLSTVSQKRRTSRVRVTTSIADNCDGMITERHLAMLCETLLNNAYDALHQRSPKGGSIDVSLRREGKLVTLRICDDGVGMERSVSDRLFEPFFTTEPGEKAGLGMSFVRKIVDFYNGTIHYDTGVGVGTTVTVRLPLAPSIVTAQRRDGKQNASRLDGFTKASEESLIVWIDDPSHMVATFGNLFVVIWRDTSAMKDIYREAAPIVEQVLAKHGGKCATLIILGHQCGLPTLAGCKAIIAMDKAYQRHCAAFALVTESAPPVAAMLRLLTTRIFARQIKIRRSFFGTVGCAMNWLSHALACDGQELNADRARNVVEEARKASRFELRRVT